MGAREKLVEILNNDTLNLPITYSGDFMEEVTSRLQDFSQLINSYPDIFSKEDIQLIDELISTLLSSLEIYLKGQPAFAYNEFSRIIDEIKCYLSLFDHEFGESHNGSLYRMRNGSNHNFKRRDMFHIPFELRGKAATQRYSIPGLPSLYLGSSSYICWEELNRPDLNTVNTSRVEITDCSYLNFGLTPKVFSEILYKDSEQDLGRLKMYESALKAYIICWPLIACCSIKVKNRKDSFKPEYIIPQLLLQWITNDDKYSGVCYFSVNIHQHNYNYELTKNYVFPVKDYPKNGYCDKLRSSFKLSRPVPWQVYQLNHPTVFCGKPSDRKMGICEGDNSYELTQFGKLEQYLSHLTIDDVLVD